MSFGWAKCSIAHDSSSSLSSTSKGMPTTTLFEDEWIIVFQKYCEKNIAVIVPLLVDSLSTLEWILSLSMHAKMDPDKKDNLVDLSLSKSWLRSITKKWLETQSESTFTLQISVCGRVIWRISKEGGIIWIISCCVRQIKASSSNSGTFWIWFGRRGEEAINSLSL